MKKSTKIASIAVVPLLLVAACGNGGDADGGSDGGEQFALRVLTHAEPTNYEDSILFTQMFLERLEERSDGRITVATIAGPETIPSSDQMTSVSSGSFDIVSTFTQHAGQVPETEISQMSRLTPAEERESGFYDWYVDAHVDKIGVTPIGRTSTNSGFHLWLTEPVESMADLAGRSVRSHAGFDPFLQQLNMETQHMPVSEIYTALDRGVVDAAPYPIYAYDHGFHEVAPYALEPAFGGAHSTWHYINTNLLNSMPEDLQELVAEVQLELEGEMEELVAGWHGEERERLEADGVEFIWLPEDEREEFMDMYIEARFDNFEERGQMSPETIQTARELSGN